MDAKLFQFFRLLELTRSQLQSGYVSSGIPKTEISDLAQHHYLVTVFAWQLVRVVKEAHGTINGERVLEICLVHDLGEIFGGDIGMPYALANPKARQAAKKFERENQRYLAQVFAKMKLSRLFKEAMEPHTDEALVAKIADYLETVHFKLYVGHLTKNDVIMFEERVSNFVKQIGDQLTKRAISKFVKDWSKCLNNQKAAELFDADKLR